MRILQKITRFAAALTLGTLTLAAQPALADEFQGGGVLFNFTGCEGSQWTGTIPVRVTLIPRSGTTLTSTLSIFPTGSNIALMFRLRGRLQTSTRLLLTGGSIFQNGNTPMTANPMSMLVEVAHDGAEGNVALARRIQMHIYFRNFASMRNCQANLALTALNTDRLE